MKLQIEFTSRARLTLLALSLLISLGLPVLLNLAVPPPTLRDEMRGGLPDLNDLFDPLAYAHGMYAPEVAPDGMTFRWSGAHAALTFPYAAQLGRNMTVGVRLAGVRTPGQSPPNVTIALNGKEIGSFTATTEPTVYTATLDTHVTPNPGLDPAHVQVEISSDTVTIPPDPRQLGVVVDWIELKPGRSSTETVLEAAVWGITLLAVLIIATARLPLMWGVAYGVGALISFIVLHLTYLPRGIGLPVEIGLAGVAWGVVAWLAPKAKPVWGLGLAMCGMWLVIAGRIMGDWQMDDAYISYRYAWNLLHGHGLVYNPGEVVEGYTNFLWTLFSAIPISLGVPPATVTLAANIALSIGIVALTFHIAAGLSGRAYVWPLLSAALIVTDGSIVSYGARGSGMESALFAFLVLLAAACLWSSQETRIAWRVCGGIALALASLTRPEGLLVAAVFLGVRAWQDIKRSSKFKVQGSKLDLPSGKLLLAALVPFLVIVVPYQAWRIIFYGYPFPNTFYAKTGATLALIERGWNYAAYFLGERWLLVALAIFGLAFNLFQRAAIRGMTLAFLILIPLYTLYIIWIGGDHFPAWRFFVPIVAPLVIVAVDAARRATQGFSLAAPSMRWATAMLSLVISAYIVSALWLQEPESVQAESTRLHNTYVNRWGAAGIWLRDNTLPGTWTAAKGAGAIAYYSERPVIDVYGLNDLHIGHLGVATMGESNPGHDKSDPVYVLDREPDYILDEWLGYFQPVKGRLKQEYKYEVSRAATGHDIAWWHRK
ncbi:MAG TPA: hypothetical protein VJ183_14155 [Chloroflexia bacterium]|nr:hypothetical protein [Chloroflexia bacterium]